MKGKILDSYGEELLVLEKGIVYSLGRERADSGWGLLIDDIFVSRKHASLGFDGGFFISDEDSRNGTFVNEERLKSGKKVYLSSGDKLRLADREFEFLISEEVRENTVKEEPAVNDTPEIHEEESVAEEISESGEWGPYKFSLRSSAAGRRLSVETEKKGCIEYQIRMIEENPGLMIGEVIHVRKIENDCFLCDVGGRFSLKDYLEKYGNSVDGIEIVDRILKLVKLGEEHMLDRDKYFLTASTIFVDKDGELMLVYIPHMGKSDNCFANGMIEICSLLSEFCEDQKAGLLSMKRVFKENVCDTREFIKHVYHYKLIDFPKGGAEQKVKSGVNIPVKLIISIISFILFMAVFWMTETDYLTLGAILLILTGGNILLYTANPGKMISKKAAQDKL